MKVVFLSHFYPRCRREEYLYKSKVGLAAAADAHQYAIALGLNSVCNDLEIVNVPALFYYPFRYKNMSIPDEIIKENGLTIHNVGYNLLMEYTFISQYKKTKAVLESIISESTDDVYIVVYGIRSQAMRASFEIKEKYGNRIKVADIIPDLPQDVNTHGKYLTQLLSKFRSLYIKPVNYYLPMFDSYVLLTEFMREKVPTKDNNYIVSEGIYEETVTKRISHYEDPQCFTLFYGGMLYKKFGIMNLVNAVHSIENPNIRLQLCGYGDCVDKVKEFSDLDSRIQYLGVVSRDEVLNYQSKASLLVNPRIPDDNPYTHYSFPSKTLEYFASGTPTLLYQLDGIPQEYYQYCFSLDAKHTSPKDLSKKILEIMSIPVEERLSIANAARKFVLEEKNQIKAAKRIMELLKRTM